MFDPKFFDEFAKKFTEGLPPGIKDLQQDLEKNVKAVIQSTISKLEIVTREEFDVQTQVLTRTREQLDQLEKRLNILEENEVVDQSEIGI